jgi:hypothetical protein
MKKLQLTNILLSSVVMIFMTLLWGYSFRQGWPIKEIILAGLIFFVLILSIATRFYRKNMEENGWIKTACRINIAITIFCFVILIFAGWYDINYGSNYNFGGFLLFVGTLILWPSIEIISGILFIIGYFKARNLQISENKNK